MKITAAFYALSFLLPAEPNHPGYEAALVFSPLEFLVVLGKPGGFGAGSLSGSAKILAVSPINFFIPAAIFLVLRRKADRYAHLLAAYAFAAQLSFPFILDDDHLSFGYWVWLFSGLSVAVLTILRWRRNAG